MKESNNIRRIIKNNERRLQVLREQEALDGRSVDPAVLLEIEDIQKNIEDLEAELILLEGNNAHLNPQIPNRNTVAFHAGGPLTYKQADVYIPRSADLLASIQMLNMNYLLVFHPRQQGKTSFINNLIHHLNLNNIIFIYIDLSPFRYPSEFDWYQTLYKKIVNNKNLSEKQWPIKPENGNMWYEFLIELAQFAAITDNRIVIILDEMGTKIFPGAQRFFEILRQIYNERGSEPYLEQLTFCLVGILDPDELCENDGAFPFNVGYSVNLTDFTQIQIQELTSKGGWPQENAKLLADRIHFWTDGQPYLTQRLCQDLSLISNATPSDVDQSVQMLINTDKKHLVPLRKRLKADENQGLLDHLIEIENTIIEFDLSGPPWQTKLMKILGVIKVNNQNRLIVRNRIYRKALNI